MADDDERPPRGSARRHGDARGERGSTGVRVPDALEAAADLHCGHGSEERVTGVPS